MKTFLILSSLLSFILLSGVYNVDNSRSSLVVEGTSNLHDWTLTAKTISGSIEASREGSAIRNIPQLKISVPVFGLRSGNSTMDQNVYKTLKGSEYSTIDFDLVSVSIKDTELKLMGELTVAGKTKPIEVNATYMASSTRIFIRGEHSLKMSEYGLKPPSALMGTMKTEDLITISFNVSFKN